MLSKEPDQNLRQTICQAFQGCVRAHSGELAAYQVSCLRLSPTPTKVALQCCLLVRVGPVVWDLPLKLLRGNEGHPCMLSVGQSGALWSGTCLSAA